MNQSKNKTVLVVDDDASIRDSLRNVLEGEGYRVVLAAGTDEAEACLQKDSVDLAVLDLFMPGRDGWDLLDVTRTQHPLLPVIIMTAFIRDLEAGCTAGAGAVLAKPIDAPVILNKIETLLSQPAGENGPGTDASMNMGQTSQQRR